MARLNVALLLCNHHACSRVLQVLQVLSDVEKAASVHVYGGGVVRGDAPDWVGMRDAKLGP